MGKKKISFTTQIVICVAIFLVVIYAFMGKSIIDQAREAFKDDIQGRMLDVAKAAAANIDGNTLKNLKADERDTAAFRNVAYELLAFKNNIDLTDIYCVAKVSDDEFIFTLDPIEDFKNYGESVVSTPALRQAGLGIPSADEEPYEDRWGRFYSAYAPVFDSYGNLAGIVAVDYEAGKLEEQVKYLTFSILNNGILSLIIGALLVSVIASHIIRRLRDVNSELALLENDIDALTSQLAVPGYEYESAEGDNGSGIKAKSGDVVQKLGDQIYHMRRDVEAYINHMSSQANSMVASLSEDYRSVYYVNLDEDYGICYRAHAHIRKEDQLKDGEEFPYMDTFRKYVNIYVKEEFREAYMDFIQPENIRAGLAESPVITFLYMSTHEGIESYEMMRIASADRIGSGKDGKIHSVSIGFTDVDIETRKTLETSRALSDALSLAEEASKAKTAFLSNMSHEIRTPMNAIISLDSIALADPDISEKTRDYLAKIGASAKHLLKIINDILDMSRIEAGRVSIKSEEFSMPELFEQINTIVDSQCNDKGLKFENHLDDNLKYYYIGDALKLKQILINILGNAVKYTEPGGTVSFMAEKIIGFANKTTMRFTIKDTGVGMDPEFLPKVFEAFSQEDTSATSKTNSTGLGMAITKSIVEMMNGKIEVESEKNVGSTFIVTLTFLDSDREEDGRGRIKASDLKVLVVSDNVVSTSYVGIEMGEGGVSVDSAATSAEAVEKVRVHEARHNYYNMVIVDREMMGENFLDVILAVKKASSFEDLVIILMAYQFRDIVDEARKAGVTLLLSKPITYETVIDKYTQTISAHAGDKKEIDFTGRHILLAEDKEINAEIMTMVLQMKRIEVEVAANGKEAVDMFAGKEEGYYCAILMDMRMPEMDGITATEIIRKMDRPDAADIPIIALTANAFDEDVERSLQAGLNAHLTKPVEPDLLFDTLRRLIKE